MVNEMKKAEDREYEYSAADVIMGGKLKDLYSSRELCINCRLCRDTDGVVFVFWHWLNQGAGPDHDSRVVKSVEELRNCLAEDVKRGLVSAEKLNQLCEECKVFFEK